MPQAVAPSARYRFVELGLFEGVGVLIPSAAGVAYENQVGGVLCWREQLTGAFALLGCSDAQLQALMGLKFPAGTPGITEELAHAIDQFLSEVVSGDMYVDRAKIGACWEAWVHVVIRSPGTCQSGVLTWDNSD